MAKFVCRFSNVSNSCKCIFNSTCLLESHSLEYTMTHQTCEYDCHWGHLGDVWQNLVILDFLSSSGWFTSHSFFGWLSTTTMCSGSLIYLLARPGRSHGGGYRRTCQLLRTSFWTFTRFGRKVAGSNSTGLFLELTLEEPVFLQCEYYSIILLQQEASALWSRVVINNNGILIHCS
jgi:hypothetical protein